MISPMTTSLARSLYPVCRTDKLMEWKRERARLSETPGMHAALVWHIWGGTWSGCSAPTFAATIGNSHFPPVPQLTHIVAAYAAHCAYDRLHLLDFENFMDHCGRIAATLLFSLATWHYSVRAECYTSIRISEPRSRELPGG